LDHITVMSRLVIYGAGGFGREVLTAARANPGATLADDRTVPGAIQSDAIAAADMVVIAIADGATRRKVARRFPNAGAVFAPTCVIGADVEVGEGAIFCDFTMVTASARIGRHFHCNIYSYVAHDCVIGDFVTFAPRVCVNGNVVIEDDVYVGAGAIIKNGVPGGEVRIGRGAVIGCGAVVTKSVPAGVTVVGNPARILERKVPALKAVEA
jgi:sugar O-acyltransferase (sialic acid O-acetyltransferase NeuD family)